MAQVALAWALNKDGDNRTHSLLAFSLGLNYCNFAGISAVVIGTTSISNLKDSIGEWFLRLTSLWIPFDCPKGAVNVKLSDKEIDFLEEPYQPQQIIGH